MHKSRSCAGQLYKVNIPSEFSAKKSKKKH